MYWWSARLQHGISNNMCFIKRHVLLEVMFYLRVCIIGGHVLLFGYMFYRWAYLTGYVTQETPYMRTSLTGGMFYACII